MSFRKIFWFMLIGYIPLVLIQLIGGNGFYFGLESYLNAEDFQILNVLILASIFSTWLIPKVEKYKYKETLREGGYRFTSKHEAIRNGKRFKITEVREMTIISNPEFKVEEIETP